MSQRGNFRGRNRRLYNATGVPGWVRFGSSPGFAGGGRGMGPCAQYLQETGQMDEFVKNLFETNPNSQARQNVTNNSNYQAWQNVTNNPNWNFQAVNDDDLKKRISELENELKDLKKQLKTRR
ncbi:MAG: hypothetical protein ACTSSH_05685 [Candidatus Heimdallarchaeota archaeon]